MLRDFTFPAFAVLAFAACGDADNSTSRPSGVVETGPIAFTEACAEGDHTTIVAVGDILLHSPLQKQAFRYDGIGETIPEEVESAPGFRTLWGEVETFLRSGDVTYGNLEGPVAEGATKAGSIVTDPGPRFDNVVYTSFPMFNYQENLVSDLVTTGFDVVSTANNHALDRYRTGVDLTIDALEAAGLPYTGTLRQSDSTKAADDPTKPPFYTFTDENGFKIAWLACTFSTNGLSDSKNQVLGCYEDTSFILETIADLAVQSDIDAVFVTPHWGQEYDYSPNQKEQDLAHRFLDAGATAVLGSHPHVLQPWENYRTPDGRETFIIYSLGNFVSGQTHTYQKSTLILYLGLTRTKDGRVIVNGARYAPMYMTSTGGWYTLKSVELDDALDFSREMTVAMFGEDNIVHASEITGSPVVTNAECF